MMKAQLTQAVPAPSGGFSISDTPYHFAESSKMIRIQAG